MRWPVGARGQERYVAQHLVRGDRRGPGRALPGAPLSDARRRCGILERPKPSPEHSQRVLTLVRHVVDPYDVPPRLPRRYAGSALVRDGLSMANVAGLFYQGVRMEEFG